MSAEIILMCEGFWQPVDAWMVAVTLGIPALGKIIVVCVALRRTQPEDRPKIISALAEMYRWSRPSDRPGPPG